MVGRLTGKLVTKNSEPSKKEENSVEEIDLTDEEFDWLKIEPVKPIKVMLPILKNRINLNNLQTRSNLNTLYLSEDAFEKYKQINNNQIKILMKKVNIPQPIFPHEEREFYSCKRNLFSSNTFLQGRKSGNIKPNFHFPTQFLRLKESSIKGRPSLTHPKKTRRQVEAMEMSSYKQTMLTGRFTKPSSTF